MNIELKNRFNYRITIALLFVLTLLFGAIGIMYRAMGIFIIPLIVSFLAMLICIERKRILSLSVTFILLLFEVYVSLQSYFTIITIVSLLLAIIISVFFLKCKNKSECALFSTALLALSIVLIAIIYLMSVYDITTIKDTVDRFLIIYDDFKSDTIEKVLSIAKSSGSTEEVFSLDYLNELFDAYLNCTVAIVCILAFAIVGVTFKLFKALVRTYSKEEDKVRNWDFMPSSVFAYFYFTVAILSMFATDRENALSISIVNLYLVFMFVFAYVGYKFVNTLLRSTGRSGSTFTLLILIAIFSSFAIQILALIGAYVCVNYAKLSKNIHS